MILLVGLYILLNKIRISDIFQTFSNIFEGMTPITREPLLAVMIGDMIIAFTQLDTLILSCIDELETVSALESITVGDSDLIGRICSDLQKKHGFLWLRLK